MTAHASVKEKESIHNLRARLSLRLYPIGGGRRRREVEGGGGI